MPSTIENLKRLANPYHAYVFVTACWYSLRAVMRIVDPAMVASWFRPPIEAFRESISVEPNDLELYTIRTDAWGLLTIAAILISLADAVPLPKSMVGSALSSPESSQHKKPYARAVVAITIFHHVMTGIGSFQHWRMPSHRTVAMDIGVWGNVGLTALGIAALIYGLKDEHHLKRGRRRKEA